MTKILVITTPTFTAEAHFERQGSRWTCTRATPAVDWMEIATLDFVKLWLARNGYKYEWKTKD